MAKEDSTESQTAANGGEIGCGTVTQAAQFVGKSLTADVENGDILGPAQTNAVEGQSWVVARVDSIQLQTFDQLRGQLEQTVPDADQAAVQRVMARVMRRADVTVASKYGSWDAKSATVVPPVGATATTAPLTGAAGEQPVPAEAG